MINNSGPLKMGLLNTITECDKYLKYIVQIGRKQKCVL